MIYYIRLYSFIYTTHSLFCFTLLHIYIYPNPQPYISTPMYPVYSAATLAILSKDLEICKQMFTNGAIKPLLRVSDPNVANEACLLAGLGCIVQLCK